VEQSSLKLPLPPSKKVDLWLNKAVKNIRNPGRKKAP